MKRQEAVRSNAQFIGIYFISYLLMCGIFMGSVIVPALFFLWLLIGWKISRFFSDLLVVGDESVKFAACMFMYLIVLSALSFLGLN